MAWEAPPIFLRIPMSRDESYTNSRKGSLIGSPETGEGGGVAPSSACQDPHSYPVGTEDLEEGAFFLGHRTQGLGHQGHVGHLQQTSLLIWASAALPVTWAEAAQPFGTLGTARGGEVLPVLQKFR